MSVSDTWFKVGLVRDSTAGFSSSLPDHSFKQVLNYKVGLSNHNQQGHMGPSKLEWQTQTQTPQRHCTGM